MTDLPLSTLALDRKAHETKSKRFASPVRNKLIACGEQLLVFGVVHQALNIAKRKEKRENARMRKETVQKTGPR
jgi:hypothetical protein